MPNITNYITVFDDGSISTSTTCPCDNSGGSNNSGGTNEQPIYKEIDVACVDASTRLSPSLWKPSDVNTLGHLNRTGYGGVLIANLNEKSIDLVLPYMVVIGDSISEGHPTLHGRLHPAANIYDPLNISEPGQLSYELAQHWNIPIINQGIGGQTTQMVRNRWSRDVLAIDTNVGDGRGTRTLDFGGQKPTAVFLHCGINDVFHNTPSQTIKNNFEFFAQSCLDNNIDLVVANIGSHAAYNATREAKALEINTWLEGDFKTNNPQVTIVDYLDWSTGGTRNYSTLRANSFADDVHPSPAGYADYATHIVNSVNLPLNVSKLKLGYKLQLNVEPTKFDRISEFSMNGQNFTMTGVEEDEVQLGALVNKDNPIYRIDILNVAPVTLVAGARYTGIAVAKSVLEN